MTIPPLWLAAAALILALVALLVSLSLHRGLKQAQLTRERWFQTQMERLEREHRGLESALAGFGRHIDQLDEQGRETLDRLTQVNARIDAVAADDDQPGFGHALRLASQGRVSVDELIEDFGLSESEARLLMRVNRPDEDPRPTL
ncbi:MULTISPECIES: DUF2802 domain-containing protein [unclassified Guyparkeria]|uniref:DUF2802 domain-containing protein n=1 Tax=unclassified Guyparkeria TaxID=2626246 RepID=UPI0007336ECB|nr:MULTISPECIES: DUF2802 domain-containing protein [unclassified Guyparkeria]KTG16452.1 hypothetical protein AUR63_03625 [Guyparkeria sp. XI15]OAE85392.1 hypothetical protein AWR35_03630 [Guyparkeria sp. WRN-7]